MKNFFRTVKATFFSRSLYAKVKDESAWKGVGFLAKVSLLIAGIVGVLIIIAGLIFTPKLKSVINTYVSESYPDSLVLTIKDGLMTSNSPVPVVFPLPASLEDNKTDSPAQLFVIDTEASADTDVIQKYNTYGAATSKALIMEGGAETHVYSYKKANMVITKDAVKVFVQKAEKFGMVAFVIGTIPALFITLLFLSIGYLIFLAALAFIAWIIFKIRKMPIGYKQLYRQGVYAVGMVLLLDCVAIPLGISGKLMTAIVVLVTLLTVNMKEEAAVTYDSSVE
ncbi:MAG: DUF1189 family protein [Candidatus Paceibacterota bacterium]